MYHCARILLEIIEKSAIFHVSGKKKKTCWVEQKARRSKGVQRDGEWFSPPLIAPLIPELLSMLASCTPAKQVTPSFLFRVHPVRSCSFLSYHRLETKNVHCGSVRWSLMSDIRFRSSEQSLVLTGNTGTSLSRQRFRSSRASSLSKIELLLSADRDTRQKTYKRCNSYASIARCCICIVCISCNYPYSLYFMFLHKDILFYKQGEKNIFFRYRAYEFLLDIY